MSALNLTAFRLSARAERSMGSLLALLQDAFAAGLRIWVSWQFLASGWLKVSDWQSTLFLFREEYRVPVLPPEVAALLGTAGELVFPAFLILGFMGRLAALGLFAVNLMAVVAYAHVLLEPGFEAAVGQHVLWGGALAVLALYGTGRWSVDGMLRRGRHGGAGLVGAAR